MKTRHPAALLIALPLLLGCGKDATDTPAPSPTPPPATGITLRTEHHVDEASLTWNEILYTNAAGHAYSVTRLEYYLSELTLLGADGTADHVVPGPWYINAAHAVGFALGELPAGTYSGATVLLGLPPALNQTGALPNTLEHVNMAWPVPMGGGYHFMKFEGHFLHDGSPTGYAMHLGRNENLVTCHMPQPFTLDGAAADLVLRFDLNEVFRTPHTYDLATGNQSMGSMELMGLLRDNCADAFAIDHRP
ncbi:MAG: hypothetical protein RBT71_13275 [Flavobacteriales bacterium]|nr:hypothetical protein [Flavobacteriales bacterium]